MSRSAKWMKGMDPGGPVSAAALVALTGRLDVVTYYLPQAAEFAQDDIEYVHQLRVATRRSVVTIQIFRHLLPDRRSRKIQKMLRKLRRAAGSARDLDVLYQRLSGEKNLPHKAEMKKVLKQISRCRKESQLPLREIYHGWVRKKYQKQIRKLLERVHWRSKSPELTFEQSAVPALLPQVSKFFQASRADLKEIAALHRLRICAKQVRYSMELLATAFAPEFRTQLYPTFTEVQERLGTINDCAMANQLFEKWAVNAENVNVTVSLNEMADEERRRLETICDEFRQSWTTQRANQLWEQFRKYLPDLASA